MGKEYATDRFRFGGDGGGNGDVGHSESGSGDERRRGARPQSRPDGDVDLDVDDEHQHERNVEGAGSAVHDEARVVGQLALARRLVEEARVVPAEKRRNGDQSAEGPHHEHAEQHLKPDKAVVSN